MISPHALPLCEPDGHFCSLLAVVGSLLTFPGGIPWILMEVPRGFMIDPYFRIERDLARQYDLELISDTPVRELVLWSPHAPPGMWTGGPYLSQDGLHPNARGNEHLAQAVLAALVRVFGREILAK